MWEPKHLPFPLNIWSVISIWHVRSKEIAKSCNQNVLAAIASLTSWSKRPVVNWFFINEKWNFEEGMNYESKRFYLQCSRFKTMESLYFTTFKIQNTKFLYSSSVLHYLPLVLWDTESGGPLVLEKWRSTYRKMKGSIWELSIKARYT